MGLVADVFSEKVLARLPGRHAIGHVRYSTTGGSLLRNAQPFCANTDGGPVAIAHNGNLVNARAVRRELEGRGAIFSTTSDSEVIVHLLARSREATLEERLIDSLSRVKGAFSLVMLTQRRAGRGARPARLPARSCSAASTAPGSPPARPARSTSSAPRSSATSTRARWS